MEEPGCRMIAVAVIGACLLVMVVGFLFHIGWNWADGM